MPTNRKNLGILLIIIGLLIIILILYFSFKKSPAVTAPGPSSTTTTAQLPAATGTPSQTPVVHHTYDLSKEAPHQTNGDDLSKIAMAFAERFGSFSNQSSYSNITDLKISMTDSMRTWADSYIKQLTNQYKNNGTYYGITTRALIPQVSSFNDQTGKAVVIVTTQRTESGKSQPYNQKIDLTFLKVNGNWLIDSAHWEK
jgi:hypothetical protein